MSVHKPTSFFPKEKQKRLAKPKAFSYIRFSTPEQMKGDSLRRQVELSKTYADKHGLELDDSLHLRDLGVSAFHGRNRAAGALAAFFKAIAEQKVPRGSFLLVESLDRLSRAQLTEALTSFLQIINAGITLVTLTDGIVYNKETCDSNMGSLMMSLVIMSRAHEESATKSKRLAAAWEAKRKRIGQTNLTSLCPGWIAPKSDGNGFKLIPERAKLVRRIFSMTLSGEGKRSIARRFNEEGIEPWGRGKRKGNGWHDSYIQKILHSRAVLGEFQPHTTITGRREALDQVVTGYYPRVIDAETFARIRRRPGLPPGPSAKVGNLFTGLAFDGYSGAVMRYVDKGIRRRERCRSRYLVSDQARLDPKKPRCAVQYSKFEERLLRSLVELDWRSVLSSDKGDSATQHECDVRDIRHELEELDAVIQRLIEVLESSDVKPG